MLTYDCNSSDVFDNKIIGTWGVLQWRGRRTSEIIREIMDEEIENSWQSGDEATINSCHERQEEKNWSWVDALLQCQLREMESSRTFDRYTANAQSSIKEESMGRGRSQLVLFYE